MRDSSMDKHEDLQIALNVARDNLKSLTEKIQFRDTRKRPHWGRDNGNGQHKSFDEPDKRRNPFNSSGGGGGGGGGPAGGKRARNNVFSRLEPRQQQHHQQGNRDRIETPHQTPKLSSRVTKEMPRREDVVAAQSDEQSRARNKRMFGSLLGTLNKFCQDESRLRGRVEKKAIIEKKVDERELKERETSKLERRNLMVDRKKKLMEVRLLEIKMERMQDLSTWEENQKKARAFIRTKAGPKIFFLPKVMDEKTTLLLQESRREYDEELAKKREDMQKELVEVEARLKRELEKALEEKPAKSAERGGGDEGVEEDGQRGDNKREKFGRGGDNSFGDEDGELRSGAEEEEEDRNGAAEDDNDVEDDDDDDEEDAVHRPRLVSQVVKSQVEVSMKRTQQQDRRRHVLQSAVNKKMIISVVNNTYEGGGRRF